MFGKKPKHVKRANGTRVNQASGASHQIGVKPVEQSESERASNPCEESEPRSKERGLFFTHLRSF